MDKALALRQLLARLFELYEQRCAGHYEPAVRPAGVALQIQLHAGYVPPQLSLFTHVLF